VAYDDALPVPTPPSSYPAYETGDITTAPAALWPQPPSSSGAETTWPGYGGGDQSPAARHDGGQRRPSEKDYPHDYYR
jgi:hypothetical protein